MRPEGIRKALLEADRRPSLLHLNDGTRLRVRSREHWMLGPEFLYVLVDGNLHRVAYRNITSVAVRDHKPTRLRPV